MKLNNRSNDKMTPLMKTIFARMEKELPAVWKKSTFKWKQDFVMGFAMGAGCNFEEAKHLRALAADKDFWL